VTDPIVPSAVTSSETSSTLLSRVRSKDPDAWQRLVHLYSPLVYRWCRRAGLQEADAADVGQEVFKSVARAIDDFRHDTQGASFRGWLRTITGNKIRDFARRQRPGMEGAGGSDAYAQLQEIPEDSGDESNDPDAPDDQMLVLRRAIELVLAEFTDETRQVFLRVVVDGHAPADVARDSGISVNAVYLAKSRVKRRFREEFEGLVGDWF